MALNGSVHLKLLAKNITSQKLTDVAFPVFYRNTPIKTGNARSHTYKGTNEIDAAYPYAKRLDHGWSRQSPAGMVAPTVQAVRAYIRKVTGA
jgi:deoxyribose-phosphate aldolase